MSIVQQLTQQAKSSIPPINPGVAPSEYFRQAAGFLQQAGVYKRNGDNQGAFLYLKQFDVLIMERLPAHPLIDTPTVREEFRFNVEKCTGTIASELNNLVAVLEPPKSSSSGGGFFGKIFGSGTPTSPTSTGKPLPPPPRSNNTPPTPTSARSLPPTPPVRNSSLSDNNQMTKYEQMQYRAVETVVTNERVQENMGRGVAYLASNEQVQTYVADGVSNAAQNKQYQKMVGNSIAENSDNAMFASMARNEHVQHTVGVALANTVGNKEVQKKVGTAIANAATNKEVQRKVASGLLGAAKLGWKGAKMGGNLAVSGTKMAYEEYQNQNQNQQQQQENNWQ
jgi:hypothetical protein